MLPTASSYPFPSANHPSSSSLSGSGAETRRNSDAISAHAEFGALHNRASRALPGGTAGRVSAGMMQG